MTHALMDAQSLPIIVRDLEKAYAGQALPLRTPFRAYVEHITCTSDSNRLLYWKEYLAGVHSCNLPGDVGLSPSNTEPKSLYGYITLPNTVTTSISEICRERELTRSEFLHLAWSLVLSFFTGTRQVCFGYISSGRDSPIDGVEDIVGPLINMLIARVHLGESFSTVMAAINKYSIEHLENQHVSLAEIQHEVSVNQLFNTNITICKARGGPSAVDGSMKLVEIIEEDPHEYDVVLIATLNQDDTEVMIQYRTDFATLAYAQEIQAALHGVIGFLGSTMWQDPRAKMSGDRTAYDSLYDAYFYRTLGTDEASALDKWKSQFKAIDAGHFPSLPCATYKANINALASYMIDNLQWRNDYDVTTQVLASWAILQACYTRSTDISVGICPPGTKHGTASGVMLEPTPMQLRVDLKQHVVSYLDLVQSTITTYSELPRLPTQRLRGLSDELALAFDFQTVLSIDDASGQSRTPSPSVTSNAYYRPRVFSMHLNVSTSSVHLAASFDDYVISTRQVTRLFSQLETVIRQVCSLSDSSLILTEIDTISDNDLRCISSWNGKPYENVQDLIHNLISRRVQAMPQSLAISAWDGELTYSQLDRLSTRLAHQLIHLSIHPEVIVPIYSEKSMWVPVSVVAVMKAGGAGVMIDSTERIERACCIVSQVSATLVLTSSRNLERATQFQGVRLLVVDEASMNGFPDPEGCVARTTTS
ncbi:non-ribosomal peptide synthetase [Metarhizium guizhouense ARSEF 977]|uniref:Non-ribosomal peptide synthetase n=1 Tax=Metarhizium guizhouense (strain ARSEF 977) TaxID=1276136 RepID=A0A0B4HQ64_METGA|nr:non-ribosomal peptide synthetase [Metarhizium guizhouense ARSEF 977]